MSDNNPQPSKDSKNPHVWTIMVYLAGDNNLADESVFALTEMKAVETDQRIQVVAQLDPSGRKVRTRRFELNRSLEADTNEPKAPASKSLKVAREVLGRKRYHGRRTIIEDAIEGLPEGKVKFRDNGKEQEHDRRAAVMRDPTGETDSGNPKLLFDFISWTIDNHAADHYMIILSGHGSGPTEQEFLRDESSKGTLTIKELGQVFKDVNNLLTDKDGNKVVIDIVGIDSCLMSMAEVCHELSGGPVKYMISSESFGPQAGWPYGQILQRLNDDMKTSNTSPENLAIMVVNEHVDFYVEYAVTNGLSVDISIMDLGQAGGLIDQVNALAEELRTELRDGVRLKADGKPSDFLDQVVLAHWEAQSYNGELYVDLFDFCDCLQRRYDPKLVTAVPADDPGAAEVSYKIQRRTAVSKACSNLMDHISKSLVKSSCFMGVTFQYSNGVSIYFPWSEVAPDYNEKELSFVRHSRWRNFLEEYVSATRRPARGAESQRQPQRQLQNEGVVIALDTEVRKTPTEDKGSANVLIRSMRNPPITVIEPGLSVCTKERLK